jgi:UDP-N-acetylglucosamine 2-epimerase
LKNGDFGTTLACISRTLIVGEFKYMHMLHVADARPNFMKAAPLLRALGQANIRQTLVHTGQHYDVNMSEIFFRQLGFRSQM